MSHLAGEKYINLETYKKNGQGVRTPVWFVEMINGDGSVLYVRTSDDTGKYKRVRNNPSVQIAPCDMRGGVKGNWVKGEARIADEEEKTKAFKMLEKKYGIIYKMTRMFLSGKNYVVIAIRIT
ncbi:MAG TPA: PPOX class F420-dependent oxidoreductase [Nitrososphaeraceae archaeon]|nr:PPOX class F420-dependent oxidoreductase [Nitrososphaeraceae archaeon]